MNTKEYNILIAAVVSNLDDLTPPQFIRLAESVLIRYPLSNVDYFTINNNGEDINVGFRKVDCECPFCKYDLKTGKLKESAS